MLPEDKYFHTLTEDQLWKRYCGFLDLSVTEFMDIQRELLTDQIERVASSTLGKKIMGNRKPASIDEFRKTVPITTYDDYEPYLSERRDDALATKPEFWCHSSGRGGKFKWLPLNREVLEKWARDFIACWVLASAGTKGKVNIAPGLRVLAALPPPPYASGSGLDFFAHRFTAEIIPPLRMAKDVEFQERAKKGFEMGLNGGIDVLTAISSVLAKMGEGFAEGTGNREFSVAMLQPRVMFRLLRAILRSKMAKRRMLPKDLWSPRAIICGGLDTQIYKQDIAYYWGQEPFDFYVSTETIVLAMQSWSKKTMTFFPNTAFLEFIPHDGKNKLEANKNPHPVTVLLDQLEEGKLYEIIITQFYGLPLLRYRLDDVIKIISLKDEETGVNLPQFLIQGKVGSTIDLAGLAELDEKTIWQAIANTGIRYNDWAACKEYEQNQGFMHLYLELKDQKEPVEVATMIHEQLKIVDTDYKDVETYLKLQPVRVSLLSPGTFQRYTDEKVKEGADLAHLKPTHVNAPQQVIQRLLQLSGASTRK